MSREFRVKVTPNARRELVEQADSEQDFQYRVYVRAVPEKGKANKAVIALLAKHFGVPKSTVKIAKGELSSIKTIELDGD